MNRNAMKGIVAIMKTMGVVGQLICILFLVGVYFHTTNNYLDIPRQTSGDPFNEMSKSDPVNQEAVLEREVAAEVAAVEKLSEKVSTVYRNFD